MIRRPRAAARRRAVPRPGLAVGVAAARLPRRRAARPAAAGRSPPRTSCRHRLGGPLRATAARLLATPLTELQAAYVETFDSRRRCNLFLTYFAHGDTRKRGVALLRFKQTYLRAGFVLDDSELPDHLCVVLEFAATVDRDLGGGCCSTTAPGSSCCGSPCATPAPRGRRRVGPRRTLPPLRGDEWDAVRRLAAEGPPEEEVGLDPYAGPAFDPALDGRPGAPQPLPMPSFPGGR